MRSAELLWSAEEDTLVLLDVTVTCNATAHLLTCASLCYVWGNYSLMNLASLRRVQELLSKLFLALQAQVCAGFFHSCTAFSDLILSRGMKEGSAVGERSEPGVQRPPWKSLPCVAVRAVCLCPVWKQPYLQGYDWGFVLGWVSFLSDSVGLPREQFPIKWCKMAHVCWELGAVPTSLCAFSRSSIAKQCEVFFTPIFQIRKWKQH